MSSLLEFPLEAGGTIVVEVDRTTAGTTRASRPGEVAERAQETFEAALAPVAPVAEALFARLLDLTERPEEVTVEFGIKLSGKLNAIISSTAGEANFTVTMKWSRTGKADPSSEHTHSR